jgi:sugar phosphate isomerase/epimerase
MTARAFLSSACVKGNDVAGVVRDLAAGGVRHIELSGGNSVPPDLVSALKALADEFGLQYLVHNYFPPPERPFVLNIANADPVERKRSVAFAKGSIDQAKALGVTFYTIHAGYRTALAPGVKDDYFVKTDEKRPADYEQTLEWFADSVDTLADYAEERGMKFGVENLFPNSKEDNFSILCQAHEWDWFFKRFAGRKNIGVLVDFAHANVTTHHLGGDRELLIRHFFDRYLDKILEVHLSDNDGRYDAHWHPKKDSWMLSLLKTLPLEGIPVTLESRGNSVREAIDAFRIVEGCLYAER